MLNKGMLTSATPEWYTPPELVRSIQKFLGAIEMDPCADPECRVPARFHFTGDPIDGLKATWRGTVYVNPPYGRGIGTWVTKALTADANEIVMLLPARTDTKWFQPLFDECVICFIAGRLKFSGCQNSAPFPSALVYRGPYQANFIRHFAYLGKFN